MTRQQDTKVNAASDPLPSDLRRVDLEPTPPEALPRPEENLDSDGSPPIDGGVAEHPIHDDDLEDLGPEDYEQEVDEVAAEAEAKVDDEV
jgi:hypothetical protein